MHGRPESSWICYGESRLWDSSGLSPVFSVLIVLAILPPVSVPFQRKQYLLTSFFLLLIPVVIASSVINALLDSEESDNVGAVETDGPRRVRAWKELIAG
jgi:hypothetical protein